MLRRNVLFAGAGLLGLLYRAKSGIAEDLTLSDAEKQALWNNLKGSLWSGTADNGDRIFVKFTQEFEMIHVARGNITSIDQRPGYDVKAQLYRGQLWWTVPSCADGCHAGAGYILTFNDPKNPTQVNGKVGVGASYQTTFALKRQA